MGKEELLDDWSRVQEMFGELANPNHLAGLASTGLTQEGRGAILLHLALGEPVDYYKGRKHFEKTIDQSSFKQSLLKAIDTYDVETQAIIVVSFDDVYKNQSLNYQWFGIDIIPIGQ